MSAVKANALDCMSSVDVWRGVNEWLCVLSCSLWWWLDWIRQLWAWALIQYNIQFLRKCVLWEPWRPWVDMQEHFSVFLSTNVLMAGSREYTNVEASVIHHVWLVREILIRIKFLLIFVKISKSVIKSQRSYSDWIDHMPDISVWFISQKHLRAS